LLQTSKSIFLKVLVLEFEIYPMIVLWFLLKFLHFFGQIKVSNLLLHQ